METEVSRTTFVTDKTTITLSDTVNYFSDVEKNPSFKASLLKLQPNLMAFAMRLTADRDAAHDLVQDTTLKALTNEEKFVDNTNFKGWMLTIMRNIFINSYRKTTKTKTIVDATENLYNLNMHESSGATTEGTYAVTEISETIARFPETYREPFNLHIAGYKYEEIAEKLSMPLGTVKSRIFFTRQKLREMLGDYR